MRNEVKTKDQLIDEFEKMHQRISELEALETNRKEAEKALRESEEKFRNLVQTIPECVYSALPDAGISYMSPAVETIFGYSVEEFQSDKNLWIRLIHPDDQREVLANVEKLLKDGVPYILEFRMERKDGNIIWIRDRCQTILDEKGKPAKFTGIIYDITEQKRAHEALQESEKRYRILAENVPDVIWTMDMDLRYTYVSPSVGRLTGYSVEEVMAQTLEDLLTPASLEVARNVFLEVMAIKNIGPDHPYGARTLELELKCKEGSTVWTEIKMNFLYDSYGKPSGILGIARDITKRKRVEEALTKREIEILKLIVDGKSSKEIADLLFISRRTVENHRANIMRKLSAKKTTDLIKYVVRT